MVVDSRDINFARVSQVTIESHLMIPLLAPLSTSDPRLLCLCKLTRYQMRAGSCVVEERPFSTEGTPTHVVWSGTLLDILASWSCGKASKVGEVNQPWLVENPGGRDLQACWDRLECH